VASDVSLADLPFLATLADSPRAADRQLWLRVAADYALARPLAPSTRPPEFAAAFDAALAKADDVTRAALALKLADCLAAADVVATIESLVSALEIQDPATSRHALAIVEREPFVVRVLRLRLAAAVNSG